MVSLTISSSVKSVNGVFGKQNYNAISGVTVAEGSIFTVKTLSTGETLFLSGGDAAAVADDGGPYTLEYVFGVASDGTLNLSYSTTEIDINAIASGAFYGDTSVKSVTIPYTVVNIGEEAFRGATNLTTVAFEALPEGYSSEQYALTFGEGVFRQCTALTSITLPERLTSIPAYTFYQCTATGFTTLAVPASVKSVGSYAFGDNTGTNYRSKLTTITFANGSNLTTLAGYAFCGCTALTSLSVPGGVTSLSGGHEFDNCSALTSMRFAASSVTVSGDGTFYNCSKLASISLTGFTSISEQMFYGCAALTSVEIPYTVTNIGKAAFSGCTSLEAVTFTDVPAGETKSNYPLQMADAGLQSDGVFYNCTSLERVILSDRLSKIGGCAFYGSGVSIITYIGDANYNNSETAENYFALPEGIAIGNYAFEGTKFTSVDLSGIDAENCGVGIFMNCTELKSATLAEGLAYIPAQIFSGCTSLSSVEIPSTVTSIGEGAFQGTKITSVTIPSSVTEIPAYAFQGCSSLVTVSYAGGCVVTSVGNFAFSGCTSLSSIDLTSVTTVGESAFQGCSALAEPDLEGIVTMGASAFAGSGVKEVSLTNLAVSSLTASSGAFSGCVSLTTVVLSSELEYVSEDMFKGATNLTSVYYEGYLSDGYEEGQSVLPSKLKGIGYGAFASTSLQSIVIPGSVEKLESGTYDYNGTQITNYGAFYDDKELETVEMDDGVEEIGCLTFYGCVSLTEVTIPASVEIVGAGAFAGCTSLSSVTFDEFLSTGEMNASGLSFWGGASASTDGVFAGDTSLKEIILPERTYEVGANMFYGCTSLVGVEIPRSCTYFQRGVSASAEVSAANTFYGCSALESVIFGAGSTTTEIPAGMFYECAALEGLTLPETVEKIGANAFENCLSLVTVALPGGLLSIGASAFSGSGLEEISIPDDCDDIGEKAFYMCRSLVEINVMSNNKTYASRDGILTDAAGGIICFPAGISGTTVIGGDLYIEEEYAFAFSSLSRVELGEGCTSIPGYAFYSASLEEIVVPATLKNVEDYAFDGCTDLTSVYFEGSEDAWNVAVGTLGNTCFENAAKYWLSETEPAFNGDANGYEGYFWHYDENGDVTVWAFSYEIYTSGDGSKVLYDDDSDSIRWIIVDSETLDVSSEKTDEGYVVTTLEGKSYKVTLDGTNMNATLEEIEEDPEP